MSAYFLIFLAMAALVYTEYTKAAAAKLRIYTASMAACLILLAGFVTRSYVADAWALVPACLGAFAGTYASMRWGRN